MKYPRVNFRISFIIIALIILAGLVLSCENKIDNIKKTDFLTLPSMSAKNSRSFVLDSGLRQLEMVAPLVEQYKNGDVPYYEFKKGIKVYFHDGRKDTVASVSAQYAKYTDSKQLWELKDSVVVINEVNDKLETEVLFWDQQKDLIYTDRFVKITSEDQIIQGFGFESDPRLVKRRIKKVSATIYLKDEE